MARLPHGSVTKDAPWNAYGMLKERSRQVKHVNGRQELTSDEKWVMNEESPRLRSLFWAFGACKIDVAKLYLLVRYVVH